MAESGCAGGPRESLGERSPYAELEAALGHSFADRSLAERALTHSSFAHEARGRRRSEPPLHNETLEFLGDAVLGFIVAERLWTLCGGWGEGELSRRRAAVVRESALARCAEAAGVGPLLKLGKGADSPEDRSKPSILSDAMEALFAAVYLDGGLEKARAAVTRCLGGAIDAAMQGDALSAVDDSKTRLQEALHAKKITKVTYRVVSERGPDHDKTFAVEVSAGGVALGTGAGRSKKAAEQLAAAAALKRLDVLGPDERADAIKQPESRKSAEAAESATAVESAEAAEVGGQRT